MASTQNRNTKSDYCYQQQDFRGIFNHATYVNGQNGRAFTDAIPDVGYLPSHMSRESFSKNSVDIESALFGINSTNLVDPQAPVVPQLKELPYCSFFDRMPLIMPTPLVIEKNQRPFQI